MSKAPLFISGSSSNSFASFTIQNRLPQILNNIINDNNLSFVQKKNILNLKDEVLNGVIQNITNLTQEELPYWSDFFYYYVGQTYFTAPFFMVEAYFYRRILENLDFNPHQYSDPFAKQKVENLIINHSFIENILTNFITPTQRYSNTYLNNLINFDLWSNSADLSQLTTNQSVIWDNNIKNLVINKINDLQIFLNRVPQFNRFDIICDNAGLELTIDLALAWYLLTTKKVKNIVFHLKYYPTFVSDATIADVWHHIQFFNSTASPIFNLFGQAIQKLVASDKIIFKSHLFWNSPLHFTKFPSEIQLALNQSDLLIFKGDANYRRLFEDRDWDSETIVNSLLSYLSTPCLLLRTLKSEIIVGLSQEDKIQASYKDINWLINGKFGLIEFYHP